MTKLNRTQLETELGQNQISVWYFSLDSLMWCPRNHNHFKVSTKLAWDTELAQDWPNMYRTFWRRVRL